MPQRHDRERSPSQIAEIWILLGSTWVCNHILIIIKVHTNSPSLGSKGTDGSDISAPGFRNNPIDARIWPLLLLGSCKSRNLEPGSPVKLRRSVVLAGAGSIAFAASSKLRMTSPRYWIKGCNNSSSSQMPRQQSYHKINNFCNSHV